MSEKQQTTPEDFQKLASENPGAFNAFITRAIAHRVNALRGLRGVSADFVLDQLAKGNDATQAKAELADVLTQRVSADAVAQATSTDAAAALAKKK